MWFDITLCPNIIFSMSRRNATFWSKVGETVVGKMGVGEQGPIPSAELASTEMHGINYTLKM